MQTAVKSSNVTRVNVLHSYRKEEWETGLCNSLCCLQYHVVMCRRFEQTLQLAVKYIVVCGVSYLLVWSKLLTPATFLYCVTVSCVQCFHE